MIVDSMKKALSSRLTALVLGLIPALTAVADDTEIYFTDLEGAEGVANVLFILDYSGSMAKNPAGDTLPDGAEDTNSRHQIMRRVFDSVLADMPNSISAGLMNYGGHELAATANGVKYPVGVLSEAQRDGLTATLDGFEVSGYTPIVQSLYEAALYFKGDKAYYGSSANEVQEAHPGSLDEAASSTEGETTTVTEQCIQGDHCDKIAEEEGNTLTGNCEVAPASEGGTFIGDGDVCIGDLDEAGNCSAWNQVEITVPPTPERTLCDYEKEVTTYSANYKYESPILSECQPNYIVLLSDGEPDDGEAGQDPTIAPKVQTLTGTACTEVAGDGRCGPEITEYLANNDLRNDLEDQQSVKTYTIGFANTGSGNEYLAALANLGEGSDSSDAFFAADDEARLKQVFTEIIEDIAGQSSSLLPPTLSADDASAFETGDMVYLPLFRPGYLPRWVGNLKKYGRDGSALKDKNNKDILKNGVIDPDTQDFWSEETNTGSVREGGAASLLGTTRPVYTDIASGKGLVTLTADSASADAMELEADDAGLHAEIVQFAQGIDPEDGLARNAMGDILHSRPVLVNYGGDGSDAKVVFASTNEGYLHAFNAESGKELFAFMPQAVLPILPTLYKNDPEDSHPYGMDGPLTVWRNDINENGIIDGDDHVYLYAGMRRGGKNYYALDVTKPSSPKLMWTIKGGETSGFNLLGQTWSKPIVAKVELEKDTQPTDVLIFGGGYDEQHDEMSCDGVEVDSIADCPTENLVRNETKGRVADDVGRKVFVVDAKSGDLLWSFGSDHQSNVQLTDMNNAIAANIKVVDMDGNGVSDRAYVADLGGRVFRIDFPDSEHRQFDDVDELTTPRARLFADFGGANAETNRRFFYEPDVSVVQEGIKRYVAVILGSGYRAHPLDKGEGATQNSIFMVKDFAVTSLLETEFSPITKSGLANVTPGALPRTANGWFYDLDQTGGEKVLAKAVTVNNVVYLTSFIPSDPPANIQCSPATHKAALYTIDVRDGGGIPRYVDGEEQDVRSERVEYISTTDILSEASLLFSKGPGGAVTVDVLVGSGLTPIDVESTELPSLLKVYWEEER